MYVTLGAWGEPSQIHRIPTEWPNMKALYQLGLTGVETVQNEYRLYKQEVGWESCLAANIGQRVEAEATENNGLGRHSQGQNWALSKQHSLLWNKEPWQFVPGWSSKMLWTHDCSELLLPLSFLYFPSFYLALYSKEWQTATGSTSFGYIWSFRSFTTLQMDLERLFGGSSRGAQLLICSWPKNDPPVSGKVILFHWAHSFGMNAHGTVTEEGATGLASQISRTNPGDRWRDRCHSHITLTFYLSLLFEWDLFLIGL